MVGSLKPPDYCVSNTLPNLKIRPDLPIDSVMVDMLLLASDAAAALNITMFVGGAMARDLLLRHVFGQQVGRATRDIDLGVLVNSWDDFLNLKSQLLATKKFSAQPGSFQRLYYEHSYPLDLLPFGPIERSDRTIAWPPEHNPIMSVLGFAEAHRASLSIELTPGFSVQVASLPSLALMKLIAWLGRKEERDASDLLLIARHYFRSGMEDRLYGPEYSLLQAFDHDPDIAGAALLGKDAAMLAEPETAHVITNLLHTTEQRQKLLDHMLRSNRQMVGIESSQTPDRYLNAFETGFTS